MFPSRVQKFCFGLAVCSILALAADLPAKEKAPEWLSALTAVKTVQPGPDDSAVVLLDDGAVTISPEGVSTTRTRWAARMVTREGRKYARAHVSYSQDYQKVKSFKAWVIRPDTQVIAYGKDRIVDQAVYSSALELYGDAHEQQIEAGEDIVPGTVFGFESVVEARVISSENIWGFQANLPVEQSSYTITLPPGWEAKSRLFNIESLSPQVSGPSTTWALNRLAPAKSEPLAPPSQSCTPWMALTVRPPATSRATLNFPTFDSWQAMAAYYLPKYNTAASLDPTIKAKAEAITAKTATSWEKIRALCRYAQQVNYISISLDSGKGGGYIPRSAAQVLRCNYGDCKEKSTLLRALLAGAEIISYPVIVYSGDSRHVREDWTSPLQFNHCILAIQVDDSVKAPAVAVHPTLGRLLFFDPTDEYIPVGHLPSQDAESSALILSSQTEQLFRLPGATPGQNRCERVITAKIRPDGAIFGRIQEVFTDQSSAGVRIEYRAESPSEYQRHLERWLANTLAAPRAKDVKAEDKFDEARFDLSLNFEAENYGKPMQNRLLVFKPVMVARRDTIPLRKGSRTQPVVLSANSFSEHSEIELPQGFRVDEKLAPVDVKTAFGHYQAKATEEAGKLIFERSLDISSAQIPAADYESVRTFFEKILQSEQTPVVLERI